jgi:hypothetical protein
MRPRSSNLPKVHVPSVGLVLAREVLLEITHQVLQHVDVLALRAQHSEALHKHGPILGCQFVPIPLARVGDEADHLGVVLGAVGHQRQLVGAMELACPMPKA